MELQVFTNSTLTAPQGNRETRIQYYHNLAMQAASVAKFAALACGIELIRAKAELPARKFRPFVDRECGFTIRTAYKYMALAGFAFGESDDVILGSREEAAKLAQSVETKIDGKSLKDIYVEAGIIKPSSSQGGKREGAGRPKKASDLEAELKEIEESPEENLAIANEIFTRLMKWAIQDEGLAKITAKALPKILAYLKELTAEVQKIIQVQ